MAESVNLEARVVRICDFVRRVGQASKFVSLVLRADYSSRIIRSELVAHTIRSRTLESLYCCGRPRTLDESNNLFISLSGLRNAARTQLVACWASWGDTLLVIHTTTDWIQRFEVSQWRDFAEGQRA